MKHQSTGLENMLTPEQFETLRGDFRSFLSDFRRDVERIAASASSPYRNREWAAGYLHCTVRMIDKLIAAGELPKRYRGTTTLIAVKDLEALIERETMTGKRRRSPFRKKSSPSLTG